MLTLQAKAFKTARTLLASCAVLAAAPHALAAPVTQATSPASSDTWAWVNPWVWQSLGSVTLAQHTVLISALSSSVTLVDQGWGGQDPASNQVVIGLLEDGVGLWTQHVAGAVHAWRTEHFDITDSPSALAGLNAALQGIDWSDSPVVKLAMYAVPLSYGGWELHTRNASFSVTSSDVPEPASLGLAGLGLVLAAAAGRRRKGS
jgi:PEP-CTERM motif